MNINNKYCENTQHAISLYYELVNADDNKFVEIATELNKCEQDISKNISGFLVSTRFFLMKKDVEDLKKIENQLKKLTNQNSEAIEKIVSLWKNCEKYSNDGFQAEVDAIFHKESPEQRRLTSDLLGSFSIYDRVIISYLLRRINSTAESIPNKFAMSCYNLTLIKKDVNSIKEKFPNFFQSLNLFSFLGCWYNNVKYLDGMMDIYLRTELLGFASLVAESGIDYKITFLHNIIKAIPTTKDRFEFVELYSQFPLDERADIVKQVHEFSNTYLLSPSNIYPLISFVMQTQKDQRGLILSMIGDCLIWGQSIDGLEALLKLWKKIPSSEMAEVIKSIVVFIENDVAIIQEVSGILVEESTEPRRDLLEMVKPLCKDKTSPERAGILALVAFVPLNQRVRMVEALMLFDEFKISFKGLFQQIKSGLKNEIVDLLNIASNYKKKKKSQMDILEILKAAYYFPVENFDQIMDCFPQTNCFLGDINKMVAWAIESNEEARPSIYEHLRKRLLSITTFVYARGMALNIYNNREIFLLSENHPLYQLAETILILTEQKQNPYTLFDQLEKLAQIPCLQVLPPKEMVGKELLSLKRSSFMDNVNKQDIIFQDLPADVNKASFTKLFEDIFGRIELLDPKLKNKTLDYINQTMHGVPLESTSAPVTNVLEKLSSNFINDVYIQSLLVKMHPTDTVPLTQMRFYTIVKFVMGLPNEIQSDDVLTPREEALLSMSTSIQNCSGGKSEGIANVFEWLLRDEKITSLKADLEQSSLDRRYHGKKLIDQIINRSLTATFSDSTFIKQLSNDPYILSQLAHQSIFLKNILASQVGLVHDVQFDLYSGCIHPDLLGADLAESRQKLLTQFYQFFNPMFLVNALVYDSILQASKDLSVIVDEHGKSSNQDEKRIRVNDAAGEKKSKKGSGKYFIYLYDFYQTSVKDKAHDRSVVLWENLDINKDLKMDPSTLGLDEETLDMMMPSKLTVEGARELLKEAGYLW